MTTWEVPMNRMAAAFLLLGVAAVVTGVALMHPPAAFIVGGVLVAGVGVLVLEFPRRGGDA